MAGRVIINGREVTNPVARFLVKLGALIIAGAVVTMVLLIVLPVVGVVVAGAVGIALIAVVLAVLAIPIFVVGGSVVGIILAPFAALFRGLFGKPKDDYYYY